MRDGKARVPTTAEYDRLLKVVAAGLMAERNNAMLYLSFGLGLRVGEIAILDIETVLNQNGTLKDVFVLKRKHTKNKQSREVYLTSAKVRKALEDYFTHLKKKDDLRYEAPLFKSLKGHRMSANSMQQVFARMYKAAGLEGCKSHSGRRAFANRLLINGADLRSVKTLMGHASVTMTVQYLDNQPDILRAVAAKAI